MNIGNCARLTLCLVTFSSAAAAASRPVGASEPLPVSPVGILAPMQTPSTPVPATPAPTPPLKVRHPAPAPVQAGSAPPAKSPSPAPAPSPVPPQN
jgi:hypothetical protein